ncbi:hypothetical protein CSKR_112549 [Clonorchis sinensis]|uniref:GIY-YIG domain-containing protein n=1 Tax=Clonorchis sinensis TaxID=79923 RepID=A0A419Q9V2_CLOSI|nr:hypothetical protein CSKR_112549 [Clonorchis sinensis]
MAVSQPSCFLLMEWGATAEQFFDSNGDMLPRLFRRGTKFLGRASLQKGYPERFVLKTMESVKPKPTQCLVGKKPLYMRLPFKGDPVAELITRRLRNSVGTMYMAANLYLNFNSSPTISFRLKDKLPRSTTSFCVYSFVCSCRASYVDRTTRHLSDRMREHNPISLGGSWKEPGSRGHTIVEIFVTIVTFTSKMTLMLRNTLTCKQIWLCERFIRNPAGSLVCDVSRQLNVLHQTPSCLIWHDIRGIAIHVST